MTLFPSQLVPNVLCLMATILPSPWNYSPWAYPLHDRLEGRRDVLRGTWWLGRKVYAKFQYQESSSYLGKTEQCDLACMWHSHKVMWQWRQRRCGCRHCLNQMFITFQIPETWGPWKRTGSWGVALMYGISALLRKPAKAGWLSLLYEETGRKPPSWNRLQTCCPLDLWLPHHENCGKTWCYLYTSAKKQPASISATLQ